MSVAHSMMREILDAKIESTAAELGVDPFWVELGSFIIPAAFVVLLFLAIYFVLPHAAPKEDAQDE
ncbi:TPA: hypothetical protein RQK91_004196 [Vibrio vulnificus]|nr:hypothetical protein [Vibrio vulnificus]